MTHPFRVGAIYRKDLMDILRDRRTMVAMVVVPVVLYPLLLIGFMRMAQDEEARIRTQRFIVEVDDEQTSYVLVGILKQIRAELAAIEQDEDETSAGFDVVVGRTPGELLGDEVQLRVGLGFVPGPEDHPLLRSVKIKYNEINVYSRTAMEEFTSLFDRFRDVLARQRLRQLLGGSVSQASIEIDVEMVLEPIIIDSESTASDRQRGGWALGQIVPIILVLMTITGAVYPAIDLTAGERERGTLETLMAAPVPIIHLIVGKFLVVATIGMFVACLNVASVWATMHFSGLTKSISADMPAELPASAMLIILLCMIPFALLFSAILVAVCSFARTFKEAQNYVMPVIIWAMIPAMAVTLPSVRLEGVMLVMPVANMVLLARDLFQQSATWTMVIVVLLSTTLYAIAAVAVAARLFGQEAVLFADAGSYKTMLRRSLFPPRATPTISQALLLAALLFPASFYTQTLAQGVTGDNIVNTLTLLAIVQFVMLFILLPWGLCTYLKINVVRTFRIQWPVKARIWLAVVLLGASSWVIAHQFILLQTEYIPLSDALVERLQNIANQLANAPLWELVLLLAIIPAVAEELLFRGFFLSGTAESLKKWPAILTVSVIFGIYHAMTTRIPITLLLGILLAYVCWQSKSLLPGIIIHMMHNAWSAILIHYPQLALRLGIPQEQEIAQAHLPAHVQIPAAVMFLLGLLIVMSIRERETEAEP